MSTFSLRKRFHELELSRSFRYLADIVSAILKCNEILFTLSLCNLNYLIYYYTLTNKLKLLMKLELKILYVFRNRIKEYSKNVLTLYLTVLRQSNCFGCYCWVLLEV